MKCQFAILSAAESQLAGAVCEHVLYALISTLALILAGKVKASSDVYARGEQLAVPCKLLNWEYG